MSGKTKPWDWFRSVIAGRVPTPTSIPGGGANNTNDEPGDEEMALQSDNFIVVEKRFDDSEETLAKAVINKNYEKVKGFLETREKPANLKEIKDNFLIHEAVLGKSSEILKELLTIYDDDEETLLLKDDNQMTAMHIAVENKNIKCFEAILLKNKLTLIAKDKNEDTPLHYIVKYNFLDGCEKAMEYTKASYINQRNLKSFSAVHVAAKTHNSQKILQLLLKNGGQANSKTEKGYTPVHFTAINGFNQSANILLNSIEDEEKKEFIDSQTCDGLTALMYAANKGFSSICYLLEGANVNLQDKKKYTALHYAASKGYFSIVEHLMSNGAQTHLLTNDGRSALHYAAYRNNEECLTHMLKNTDKESPQDLLKAATDHGSTACLQILLDQPKIRSEINLKFPKDNNNTLLHISIIKRFHEITKLLIEHGADKNKENDNGEYPLHLMAAQKKSDSSSEEEERIELCKLVMKRSHDLINIYNKKSETPLYLAAKSGNIDMVRSFLNKNAHIMSLDNRGFTTIHIAAKWGHETCLRKLLNCMQPREKTELMKMMPNPLHLAAQYGHLSCCETILTVRKDSGKTMLTAKFSDTEEMFPVDVAYAEKRNEVFKFLLDNMPFDHKQEKFCSRLHGYCEKSIDEGHLNTLEVIVSSNWCQVAFDSYYCPSIRESVHKRSTSELSPCLSFKKLVEKYPDLACRAMDKHITKLSDDSSRCNYAPFEFIYYNVLGNDVVPNFLPETRSPTDNAKWVPGYVDPKAREFENCCWERDHPLLQVNTTNQTKVLTHQLTRNWFALKVYVKKMVWAYILFEATMAVVAPWMFYYMWTDYTLGTTFNGTSIEELSYVFDKTKEISSVRNISYTWIDTKEDCSLVENNSRPELSFGQEWKSEKGVANMSTEDWVRTLCVLENLKTNQIWTTSLRIVTSVFWFIHTGLMTIFAYKIFRKYKNEKTALENLRKISFHLLSNFMRPLCNLFIACAFIPTSQLDLLYGVKNDFQWQVGVLAVLLCWLCLVRTLNKIPALRIFIPITRTFIKSNFKIVMHFFLILLAFALSFHFLLANNIAFSNLGYSLIKTLVWMLGDLGYDDMFLDEDSPPPYPLQSNILFVVFVTIFGVLLFNVFIKNPVDAVDVDIIKENAVLYQAKETLKVYLLVDFFFHHWRRSYARKFETIYISNKKDDNKEIIDGEQDIYQKTNHRTT